MMIAAAICVFAAVFLVLVLAGSHWLPDQTDETDEWGHDE